VRIAGLLGVHVFRRLIATQSQKHTVSHGAFAGELREAHLRDEFRLNPFRASGRFARYGQRRLRALDLGELFLQRSERLIVEAGANIAAIAQLTLFLVRQHQRRKGAAFQ
jgi:hypothetical protein